MMILYEKTESNFNHNGLAVLDDFVVSPVVSEQLNGLFLWSLIIPFMQRQAINCDLR